MLIYVCTQSAFSSFMQMQKEELVIHLALAGCIDYGANCLEEVGIIGCEHDELLKLRCPLSCGNCPQQYGLNPTFFANISAQL